MEGLLLKSVREGRIRQASLLLKSGANVEQQDKSGQTGLIKAMMHKNSKVQVNLIKLLLQYGANVSCTDEQGRNAFLWGCYLGCVEAIKYLISKCEINSLMLDGQDECGNSSLHLAAKNGHGKIVEELTKQLKLLGMQSVFLLKNNEGISALTEAFQCGHFEITKCLIVEGNVSVLELTHQIMHRKAIGWIAGNKWAPQDMIAQIVKNLSKQQDATPSETLQLLITNESFRTVALKSANFASGSEQQNQRERRVRNADTRQAATAPGRLRTNQLTSNKLDREHKQLSKKKSIKGMLPTIMDMYEAQHSINYRPSSKNEFVPYSMLNNKLRAITTRETSKISRNTLSSLPDLNRFNRLLEPKYLRTNRSTSVQLPQMNSWSMLRKKLQHSFIQEV